MGMVKSESICKNIFPFAHFCPSILNILNGCGVLQGKDSGKSIFVNNFVLMLSFFTDIGDTLGSKIKDELGGRANKVLDKTEQLLQGIARETGLGNDIGI